MKKSNKGLTIALISILMVCIAIIILFIFLIPRGKGNEETNVPISIESIENYGYSLEDRDGQLYKEVYSELKEVLKKETIDYEEYAKNLAKLYIIDLYTISNKVNKYDVGSSEFVVESYKEDFTSKVMDTLYKYVENNSNNKRSQELPTVKSVEIKDIKANKLKLGEDTLDGYSVEVEWAYEKDLGYDSSCTLDIVKQGNKLYVMEQK